MTVNIRDGVHYAGRAHTGSSSTCSLGGQGSPKRGQLVKKIVGYMYKHAVFDIKLAYNH